MFLSDFFFQGEIWSCTHKKTDASKLFWNLESLGDFPCWFSIKALLFFSKDKTIDVRKPKGVAFNVLLVGNESADILLKASETRRPRKLQVQWIYQAWIANQSTRKWIYSLVWYTLNSTIIGLIREVRCFNWQHMLLTDMKNCSP